MKTRNLFRHFSENKVGTLNGVIQYEHSHYVARVFLLGSNS